MQLIRHIEVAYFRSFYKDTLSFCRDTNVIFGRNDSGKSNLLRALNLFFNNETNPGQVFNFGRDFCHSRRAEADTAQGVRKFVYVKIWFQTPQNWRASLGDEFWVKRQWSVTTQADPALTSSITENRLQQYLTRFLNRIRFHYIPAIKDRKIFEKLQAEIYRVISAHEAFTGSLTDFATALRERTVDLSAGLLERLGITSVVSTPQDLTDLFRSLDFETRSDAGDSYSLTLQRGDGIQVQHIPLILEFISNRSAEDYHLWGFEEPENSLELASAIREAETFRRFGQQHKKQIFLTSHSPAFFMQEYPDVRRFYVSRSDNRNNRLGSLVRRIEDAPGLLPNELMGETPHLPLISTYLRKANDEIVALKEAGDALSLEIAARDQSIVFVEGASDQRVFEKAWRVLIGGDPPCLFEPAGGTTRMRSLGHDGPILNRLAPARVICALVDNDAEGRRLYETTRLNAGGHWVRNNSNGVYWCRLPLRDDFQALMLGLGIDRVAWPGNLENLFSPMLRERAEQEGSLVLTDDPSSELITPQWYRLIRPYLTRRPDLADFYIRATDPDTKETFANWVVTTADAEPEILEPLRPVFERLRTILAGNP